MKVHIKRLLPPESMFRNIIVCTSDGRKFKLGHSLSIRCFIRRWQAGILSFS